MAPTRFVIFLMGSFAAIALLVAVTGLFGVIAYAVQTRTAELGTRMALGAEQSRIMFLVLRQGALLTVLGIVVGVVGAHILARFIESMVFGVSPTDLVSLLVTALAVGAVSLLACGAPARWACRLEPAQVLRTV
jgi:ABC-type antimicrobial peptide transport system permease subunit